MALADVTTALETDLQDVEGRLQNILASHVSQLRQISAIASNPLLQAAEGALHVPPEILEGFVAGLNALASAYPRPEQPQPVEGQAA